MKISELMPRLALHGRTMFDEKSGTLYFNWTCSGFTAAFTGKTLRARLTALGDQVPAFPGLPQPPATYPCLGVEADGSGELCLRTEWREADGWCTLWSSEESGSHVVRVVKLSENARGKLGVLDYYKMQNVISDTQMRNSIAGTDDKQRSPEIKKS